MTGDISQLEEAKSNTVVLAFGRMNPPQIGHELLINKVLDIARKNNADHYVYASKTQDKKKNPLSIQQKLKYLKHSFPKVNIVGADNKVRTFIEAVKFLDPKYDNLIMIGGSDRVQEFQKLLDTYNGKEYNYKSIKVVSAGERDPDADDVSGMSASKMRQAAADNDFDLFKTGVPSTMSQSFAKQMFDDVRFGMNIKEGYEELMREQYLAGDIFNVGDIVEHNDQYYPVTFRGPNYVLINVTENEEYAKRVWLTDIYPTDYTDMNTIQMAESKLQIARIIRESFGSSFDNNDPVVIINRCLSLAKEMELTDAQLESLDNMLIIADEAGIPFDKKLAGMIGEKCEEEEEDDEELMSKGSDPDEDGDDYERLRKIKYKIQEDDDLTDEEIDEIMSELSDDEYINEVYDDDEFELVDEETGEVLEEDDDLSELNEVMSRAERMKARVRMRRTKSKRQRGAKIAMKRRSNTQTLGKRARRMAVKTLKKRFTKKPLNSLSVGEKERLEKRVQAMKPAVTKLATRMIPKMRQIEKKRFDSRSQQGK